MLRTKSVRPGRVQALCFACMLIFVTGCGPISIFSDPAPASKTMDTPVFKPGTGTYTGAQSVTLTSSIPSAVIYYTTDGSSPTASSKVYTSPISVKTNTTLKAIATASAYNSSSVASSVYSIDVAQAVAPVFSPLPGSFSGTESVILTASTPGSSIHYTLDGTVPTAASPVYTAPIPIAASMTVSAIAIAAGFADSTVVSGTYTIRGPVAASPIFSPGPGAYTSAQPVSLLSATPGALIYYTLNGATPTTLSAVYTTPITVSSSEIISAIAAGPSLSASPVVSGSYSISNPAASAPVFSPAAGSYGSPQIVTITAAIPAASIYYTTDGSRPTTASLLYTGPVTVSSSESISAIAVASGYTTSAVAKASYSIGANFTSSSSAYTFKNAQIVGGGFVDGILMHPAQKGLMYARTDVGGAYRFDASLGQWVPLTDFLTRDQANYMGIESIAIDPSDPNKLYIAAGTYADSFGTNGAILISNDQGRSFNTVPLSFKLGGNDKGRFAGERLNVDPNLGSHLYFGSRLNGLLESKDSGTTWTQVATFPVTGSASGDPSATGGVIFEDFDKSSGTSNTLTPTVYVGVVDNSIPALYATNDGGKSWAAVSGQPTGMFLNRGVLGPDRNLYLSYSNNMGPADATTGSIWRYTLPTPANPSGVWKDITPLPSFAYSSWAIGYGSVTVDPQRPGVIMATTLDLYYLHDDVFRSLDGGNSWIDLGGNQNRDGSLSPWLNFGQSSPGIGNWLVSITIDPYDSNHVLYGTGQTVWETTNATAADWTTTIAGSTTAGVVPTSWKVGALGIEEAVVLSLVSPPTGANVLSGVHDIGGFTHTTLQASPASGMHSNPLFTFTSSLDFAQGQPGTIVRVGTSYSSPQKGAYSTDGGFNWVPFKNQAGSIAGGGSVAISADASTLLWAPSDASLVYSTDNGATWTPSSSAPSKLPVVSDRINPRKFYIFDPGAGAVYSSTDHGASFSKQLPGGLPTSGILRASYAGEGDLWLATGSGLLRSSSPGAPFSRIAGVDEAYDISFGMPATGAPYPAIYLYGKLAGVQGVYRSVDGALTWTTVTDPAHQFGYINVIAADPKIFGRLYIGTSGRGVIYADPAN